MNRRKMRVQSSLWAVETILRCDEHNRWSSGRILPRSDIYAGFSNIHKRTKHEQRLQDSLAVTISRPEASSFPQNLNEQMRLPDLCGKERSLIPSFQLWRTCRCLPLVPSRPLRLGPLFFDFPCHFLFPYSVPPVQNGSGQFI